MLLLTSKQWTCEIKQEIVSCKAMTKSAFGVLGREIFFACKKFLYLVFELPKQQVEL